MAKYNLQLKGYVGAKDFNVDDVRRCLDENADSDISVLIDSTGGQLATALSIAAAFRDHGAVDVHFVGLNASAATVASLGARSITIDRSAMYLVHKCSNLVFKFQSMNADELSQYIAKLEQNKEDLDKIDDNIAAMYASRCRKKPEDLLALMQKGGWLSSAEALEWGFVDKITDYAEDDTTEITDFLISDLTAAGLPELKAKPREHTRRGLASIFTAMRDFLNSGKQKTANHNSSEAAAESGHVPELQLGSSAAAESTAAAVPNRDEAAANSTATAAADSTALTDIKVIDTGTTVARSAFQAMIDTTAAARELFNSIP